MYKLKCITIALPSNYTEARSAHQCLVDELTSGEAYKAKVGLLRSVSDKEFEVDIIPAKGTNIDEMIQDIEDWY